MRKKPLFSLTVMLFCLLSLAPNQAHSLGIAYPEGWTGVHAQAMYGLGVVDPNQGLEYFSDYHQDPALAAAEAQANSPYRRAEATARPYALAGYAESQSNDWLYEVGSFAGFKDELLFTSANGAPATIIFNFDLTATVNEIGGGSPSGYMFFDLWGQHKILDSVSINFNGAQQVSQTISLSTSGEYGKNLNDGGLVDSGTWLPITINASATAETNLSIDWLHSFELDPVNPVSVYQNGLPLGAGEYTISSTAGFPTPVPEPGTAVLLGSGLLGLVRAFRSKQKEPKE